MKRAISFVLLLTLGAISFSQNLVVNPGFESWETTTKPTSWTTAQGCLKEEAIFQSGSYACRQEGTTSSRDLGQVFSISSSKQYRFSFYYKTGTSSTGNGCRVWCEWFDDKQAPITESVLHSGFLKSESWLQYTADLTPPSGAAYFHLLVRSLPNSITYWDDFVFDESVPTTTYEEMISDILIYPNPAHNYLYVNNIHDLQHIDILNITGITLWSSDFSGDQNVTIPVSGLRDGLYIIHIRTFNKIVIKKFIKK